MSSNSPANPTIVSHKRQLVSWLETACRPANRQLIGAEWEKLLLDAESLSPVRYDGENGIAVLLDELLAFHWLPQYEDGQLIALHRGASAITLEPGGQLELASAPYDNVHDIADEMAHHLDELGSVCRVLGIKALGMGFHPKAQREDMQLMPKSRYQIMRGYMAKGGTLGLDMMLRTAGVQASFDFTSEADMTAKFRIGLALQPLVGALFACSPFRDGHLSGDLSFRNRVWQHTDPDRCGNLEFVFADGFGFEQYADWALSMPMYFVRRGSQHIDAKGGSFLDFMAGRLAALPGELPTLSDWNDHLTTVFPHVRLKRTLEMRGADSGDFRMMQALPALWTGLLYDSVALDETHQLINSWGVGARYTMVAEAPRLGMDGILAERSVRDWLKDIVAIAERGLMRRNRLSQLGEPEAIYLHPLHQLLDAGLSQAEELQRRFVDEWGGDITPAINTMWLTP